MQGGLERIWYGAHPAALALAPLGWIWGAVARGRRLAYELGLAPSHEAGRPVLVVGNVAVGGTGKTPLVVWLARFLAAEGFRPGIICGGYRGRARRWPQRVHRHSDPRIVGDEAVLLARRAGCPVAAGPDRAAAARALVANTDCDLVISDDGLQHYALMRDVEIAVIDGERRHGNGRCLPAGPLREPRGRLAAVDLVVSNGRGVKGEFEMDLEPWRAVRLDDTAITRRLEELAGETVHAVAGIGHPERFFSMLSRRGLRVLRHPFPDHHAFRPADLDFDDGRPVLMTEKDAVKCADWATPDHWYVPVRARLQPAFATRLVRLLRECGIEPAGEAGAKAPRRARRAVPERERPETTSTPGPS